MIDPESIDSTAEFLQASELKNINDAAPSYWKLVVFFAIITAVMWGIDLFRDKTWYGRDYEFAAFAVFVGPTFWQLWSRCSMAVQLHYLRTIRIEAALFAISREMNPPKDPWDIP